ncbi:MAG: YegS/Rv2252/BmrU family lipid kinase [Sphingobacteriales bacterium]|nr:YegS/Rv2252/BmrU family lipid kinase [Sphingobacteriales bacterium]
MSRHILYIINPIAGTRTKKGLQQLIEKETAARQIPYEIFPSVAGGDYSFLIPIIKEKKITDVVIAGGDGTVSQVVGSLMNCNVNFGIIPCGSGNGLALAAKIYKEPVKALDIVFNGKASAIDGFYINDRFACMLCGLGFDAKVAHDFADQPKRGLGTYAKMTLKNFFSMNQHRFLIQLENTSIETSAYFISIANGNQFGNNFTIAPKASLSDGLLDIVIVTNKNKISFLLQTLKQLAGWNKPHPTSLITEKRGVLYFQTDSLTVKNISGAPLHIDGDPAETMEELKITVSKSCFRLLQPA